MSIHTPQRILVAPSGFKESLSAEAVAQAIAAGVRRVIPGVQVDEYPVPDTFRLPKEQKQNPPRILPTNGNLHPMYADISLSRFYR